MTVSVVACGNSAEHWHDVPHDYSIGVNDAFKWGHTFNALCVFNHRNKFTKARQEVILNTRPVKLYTHCQSWLPYFPDHVLKRLRSWDGILYRNCDMLTHADTSPIIAMSLAANCLGAKTIILWGVEMITHSTYSKDNPLTREEIRKYVGYINNLQQSGINVYLGARPSALEQYIPIYKANTGA
jgi:hypothetical protein